MTSDLLAGLNREQHAAVTAGSGPILVLAGPGSGKTGVLTRRVAYLVSEQGISPRRILAVTFTNKAATEMKDRVQKYIGSDIRGLQIGTFHATCAKILRIEHEHTPYGKDYVIYDTDDQIQAVTQAMGELDISTKKFSPRGVLNMISSAKNEVILPEQYVPQDYLSEVVNRVYPRYQRILLDSNAMDFDDLLVQMVLTFRHHPSLLEKYQQKYTHVLVDEFQDTNTVQYQLVGLLAKPQNNVFVVGDEDQSIYAFRGADYRNVLRFRNDFSDAQVILLEQNYRSTQVVLDVARAVIDKNQNRTRKELFTEREGGEPVTVHEAYDDEYEARFILQEIENLRKEHDYAFSDFAIMYRTNAQSRALEDACIRVGMPYTLVGGVGFYKRREIRDMIAYLRVVNNPDDRISFARIINTPKRGIGKKSLADFQYWAAQNDLSYGDALLRLMDGDDTPLSSRAANCFAEFGEKLVQWQQIAASGKLLHLFDTITSDVGYTGYLHDISDRPEQANERGENVRELRGLLQAAEDDAQSLSEFLTDIMLMTDADTADTDGDRVTLLTLHAAKGLEFPVVFITGLEDRLLPHSRAFDEPEGLQEERRLFYVGITRAEDKLYLTYAFRRTMYGTSDVREPSMFLMDIPGDLLVDQTGELQYESKERRYREMTHWENDVSDGLNRLKNDLKKQAGERKKGHVSDEDIRSKIIAFPGSEAAKPLTYTQNMKVKHPIFGEGLVIESKRVDGAEQVTVAFQDKKYGVKTLDAEFANMKILK